MKLFSIFLICQMTGRAIVPWWSVDKVDGRPQGKMGTYWNMEAWEKWPPFYRWHFQMHFLEWKLLISYKVSLIYVRYDLIDNKLGFVLEWLHTEQATSHNLVDPILTQIYDSSKPLLNLKLTKSHLSKSSISFAQSLCTLTHWGRVTHICVNKLAIIGSDNGLSPGRRQAIIWTNAGILLIELLRTNFSEISIEIHTFSFKEMHLTMSFGKWRQFCLGLNVLTQSTAVSRACTVDGLKMIGKVINVLWANKIFRISSPASISMIYPLTSMGNPVVKITWSKHVSSQKWDFLCW